MIYDWQEASPSAVGLDENILQKGLQAINRDYPYVHSWLVARAGKLVWEKYFQAYTAEYLHEAQSVTKSIQSLLVGIAIDRQFIPSVDTPIRTYFADYTYLDWANGKDQITLRHLLTMTAGLEWNELKVPYNQVFSNDASLQIYSPDWLGYALMKPMESPPGTEFCYSSANPILISKILNEATQMSNEQFARRYLYNYLGINDLRYQKMRKNPRILADIDLSPRDMAKLGQLVLNNGKWADNQVVSTDWLAQSFAPHQFFASGEAYGLSWWLRHLPTEQAAGKSEFKIRYAWGIGGQHIFILPQYDMVVVFTGGNYEVTRPLEPYHILEKYILAAIVD
ncbi:MAG: beta-lactamase family protein [Microscillaceae bacterium]|jgi:CubicO group peptidase (beta-lactamase class C family)|nr:beta-lactamase family protein [Microscillaceae bacterium]